MNSEGTSDQGLATGQLHLEHQPAVDVMSTREKIAIAVSGAIILAAVVYWIVQIVDVLAILELAYG